MFEKLKEIFVKLSPELMTDEVLSNLKEIFEGAVEKRVSELKESIETEMEAAQLTETTEFKEELIDKLDTYLSMIAEEYMEKNKVAIEGNLKLERLEEMHGELSETFKKYGINIPEDQATFVSEAEEKIETMKDELNEATNKVIELERETLKLNANTVFENETTELSMNQREELKQIMEDIEVDDLEAFKSKIKIMKDNFLTKTKTKFNEGKKEIDGVIIERDLDPKIQDLINQI